MANTIVTDEHAPRKRLTVLLGVLEWAILKQELKSRRREEKRFDATLSHIIRDLIRKHLKH